jgi:hypothetical protein
MTSRARAHRPEAAGVAALLALALLVVAGCGGGGGDDATTASTAGGGAQSLGAALADAADEGAPGGPASSAVTESSGASGSDDEGEGEGDAPASDLPAPTFPESTPPTTVEGMEPVSIPGADGDDPIFGQLVVDLDPGGYVDLPAQLRRGQHVQVLSSADDGIRSRTTVFAPDGSTIGEWESTGRPGDIQGYYWDDEDVLPADGTYVFRVEHLGGADKPFVLSFYGEA